ncbi:DUF885 family protein [Erythrobacter citreus]|uniref:DUF885 family protein n=1 Tax=Qipengyuania citrea TaxID=225971 RepID=A0A6I4UDG8_9SPHN|nr:DUF885 domain-containing protein [Qipengyuania citrea]MDQ0564575.1 uncharacterized protein (DUF885 family) [Qipengyuania citrea]MXP36396.1 DUF885 family protein [Qipengyuania citrea]
MSQTSLSITRRQALAGLGATSALALSGCAASARPEAIAQARVIGAQRLLEVVGYNLLEHEPERATALGVDTGRHAYLRGRLEDQSPAGQQAYAATLRQDLAHVRSFPREGLDSETLTSLDVVESAYDLALDGFALPYGDTPVGNWRTAPYVVIQNVGEYLALPRFMQSNHKVENGDDADAYIERMEQMPTTFDGELARISAARAMGVVPPAFLLDKAIGQMQQTIASAGKGELFAADLRSKLQAAGMPESHANRAAILEAGPIAEALTRQLEELRAERAVASDAPGMSARPRGDEFYAWALRSSTTTRLTPDEVHEQGLDELAALHARMDPILRSIGYTSGSVGERMQALSQDPRYKFAEGDPGRTEIMDFIAERVEWIKAQMPRAFNTLVDPNMEVRRIPPAEEVGAPGAYGGAGSKDGSIPGRFWINLRTTDLHRKYDLADLTYHETIPGHVWEGEYSNRLPLIRSILAFNPFSEGWALYGEQIADELGAYDGFEVGRLGYLQSLAFRACRMVVDTGLHAKGWSRAKAVDFFVTRNGSKPAEVESEVDRYCSWPGQATGYKLGHSRIVDQRARAQGALGQAYDFKAFNDAVVLGGNVPMDVLEKYVDRYIAAARS